ncbi:hypothetical protein KIW84_051793 [Lathyrus oleraceus]|uniref:Retrotransposon gag domain-containing protein n=1 Tax=Pisum sativum TaxID=3888 RepID=A0A9D5AE34_PEA|nr:hypothetical protein KIW84_051793 [Pisum sativum]
MANNRNLSRALAAETAYERNYLCKGKLDFLTGAVAKSATGNPRYKQWKSENSLIIAWLVSSMETGIGKSFMFLPSAKDVREAVNEIYSDIQNSSQVFGLKSKLWHAKQGDRSVTAYYNELLTLWQELDLCYDDSWRCTKDNVLFLKMQKYDCVFMFLVGLNKYLDEMTVTDPCCDVVNNIDDGRLSYHRQDSATVSGRMCGE